MLVFAETRESTGLPGAAVTVGCRLSCGCWELNLSPLQEQQVLLTIESSLQPKVAFEAQTRTVVMIVCSLLVAWGVILRKQKQHHLHSLIDHTLTLAFWLQFFKLEDKMKNCLLLLGVLAIFVKAAFVTGDKRTVIADNKCMCARVTSRIIPSPDDPNEDIVERNIRIIVPLNNRENISDPTSPLRTKFVYHLSDLCKKCDPVEVELDNQVVTASQSNLCDDNSAALETCYTYDRNKCYISVVPLEYRGEIKMVETALTPDSCYPD